MVEVSRVARPQIEICADAQALAREAAAELVRLAAAAQHRRGRFTVALAGGSTPLELYRRLASAELQRQVDWAGTHVFWGDERAVAPDHPRSNFGAAHDALLSHLSLRSGLVHRIQGELGAGRAATLYAEELHRFFAGRRSSVPTLDLVLLGLGGDGHTASLFPHHEILQETDRWVAAVEAESLPERRITLTLPVLNRARTVLFLVSGAAKAAMVRRILEGPPDPLALPAQGVQPLAGRLIWMLDRPAAAELARH